MEALSRIILPAIGIFTNIGEAHSEGFLNERQKINEKLLLFRNARKLVYCRDHAVLHESILQFLHQIGEDHEGGNPVLYGWSCKHEDAEFYISDVVRIGGKTHLTARWQEREITAAIPFTDDASVENAIHCWCTSLLLGCDEDVIRAGMSSLQPVSMRLELRQGINDCTLINDAYNSDLTSLGLALSYLARQQQSVHTVILSDILEVRHREYELYEEVAALLKRYPVRRFIGIGPALFKSKHFFRSNPKLRSIFFKSTEDFIRNFHILTFDNEAILLKGARVFTFEKIAALLEQRVHQTVMTVDLPALRHNLDVFRSYLQPGVRTMAMVKAFAYGSGSREIAGLLQQAGVDYLTVAYTDEGVGLRKAGIHMPIMVMSPDVSSFDRMIAWKLEPELYNFRSFEAFVAMAANLKVTGYPVHVKLDTGMHRLGFGPSDMDQVVLRIHSCPEITIASIFTHLAAADDADMDAFTARQGELFKTMYRQLTELLDYKPLRHLCNSAGIIRHPDLHFDMVRPGIGLYGIDSSGEAGNRLMQISSLRSSVAQVRVVDAGESIGYGHDVILPEKRTIATICIGYADGYPRSLGRGRAYVTIRGFRANIIGSVCMDMCMADVTEVPGVSEGDEVTIFGKDPSVNQLAQWAGTIPYEIMTGISQRVKRIYVNEE